MQIKNVTDFPCFPKFCDMQKTPNIRYKYLPALESLAGLLANDPASFLAIHW